MKIIVLFITILMCFNTIVCQNLIERTVLGLSCQSTEEPNELSKNLAIYKTTSLLQLFKFSTKNTTKNKDEILLDISAEHLNIIKSERPSSLKVPIPVTADKRFILELYKVKIHAEGSRLITPTDTLTVSSKHLFYRGVIADDFGSIVTLSIINQNIYISVNDMHGTYRIVPHDDQQKSYDLSIDISRQERVYACGTSQEHHIGNIQLYPVGDRTSGNSREKALTDQVKIYVVCDNKIFTDAGGTTAGTQAYVDLLFTEVIALYYNEQINMVVSDIYIYTGSDPYSTNGSNTFETLKDFGNNTPNTFNGDIATLLQGGGLTQGCSLSGIAWVDVLCYKPANSNYGPYNVNWGLGDCTINPNGSTYSSGLDVSIVAHEIGHNLGSPHTHNCCWGPNQNQAIDNCVTTTACGGGNSQNCGLVPNLPQSDRSTIMSYCGNSTPFSNGFGTLPGNLIRNRVESASCLTGRGTANCTHINKTYNQQSIPNGTEVFAKNQISILNNVSVGSSSSIMLSSENSVEVLGTFTVNYGAEVEIISADCN